ncbi:hypothetical protein [Kineosporia sp. NBRC 101731]|uniref:hypothetical protein n=1 Tax=Kineosporia sp. NBRC 101731 TaxID=3032199 RepID=UPI0024A59F25|nr:hypothetical protein [Kineosporia sp. NBRC 101731]GLY29403.1 hypothetical protein Kisp02_27680 [Kineosporia sp. NBRC 101731]
MSETIVDGAVDPADYEFATVQAPRRLEWVYRDAYRHLGWVLDAFDPEGCRNPAVHATVVNLRFRREHDLPHRELMNELQAECDRALGVIAARERVKTSLVHSSTALFGVVGASLLAAAALTLDDGDLLTPVLLGALGVVVMLIGVMVRRPLTEVAKVRFGLSNDDEYAIVLETSERGAALLAAPRPQDDEVFTLAATA